jgi:hypothetical protein
MPYLPPSDFSFNKFFPAGSKSPTRQYALAIAPRARTGEGAKKMPRTLWDFAASIGNLFALSRFLFYLKSRAIRPWPPPTMGSGT